MLFARNEIKHRCVVLLLAVRALFVSSAAFVRLSFRDLPHLPPKFIARSPAIGVRKLM
jgi:hypothetical protein